MNHNNLRLAVEVTSQGVGYAVFESPKDLVDWGTRGMHTDGHAGTITQVKKLLDWYEPSVVVLEDTDAPDCLKRAGVRRVIRDACRLASAMNIRVIRIARHMVQRTCGKSPNASKDAIARRVATLFPDLAHHLPGRRRIWHGEDGRVPIFAAAALGVTAYVAYPE